MASSLLRTAPLLIVLAVLASALAIAYYVSLERPTSYSEGPGKVVGVMLAPLDFCHFSRLDDVILEGEVVGAEELYRYDSEASELEFYYNVTVKVLQVFKPPNESVVSGYVWFLAPGRGRYLMVVKHPLVASPPAVAVVESDGVTSWVEKVLNPPKMSVSRSDVDVEGGWVRVGSCLHFTFNSTPGELCITSLESNWMREFPPGKRVLLFLWRDVRDGYLKIGVKLDVEGDRAVLTHYATYFPGGWKVFSYSELVDTVKTCSTPRSTTR
ncbi:MAG: hypothetical protein ACP5KA_05780 [Desulfurococcaceae archaeon]